MRARDRSRLAAITSLPWSDARYARLTFLPWSVALYARSADDFARLNWDEELCLAYFTASLERPRSFTSNNLTRVRSDLRGWLDADIL